MKASHRKIKFKIDLHNRLRIFFSAFLIYIFCIGKAFSFSGDITDISGRQYFPSVKEVIDQAEKSIYMVMYLVNVDERNTKSRVYQLSHSLIDAHERGVAVSIILDQSVDYSRTKSGELWQTEGKKGK